MKRIFLLLPVLLALAACQSMPNPDGTPRAVVIKTKVDESVAAGTAVLRDNCTLLQTGVAIGQLFARGARVTKALGQAQAALNSYCSGPAPADVPSALAAVAAAYRAVLTASPEARAHFESGT